MGCYSCLSISGKKPLFPESRIYDGRYWLVEHAYPVKLKGWFVIVLKRHAEALHSLSGEEFLELSKVLKKITKLLFQELKPHKEYVCCFAEKKNFNHLHFHVIPRPKSLPEQYKGPKIFSLLGKKGESSIPKSEIILFCERLKNKLKSKK